MRCPRCGTELPDGSRFCSSCGTQINPQPTAPQKTPRKNNWLVTILIGVVVYFLARGAGYMFGSSIAKNTQKPAPTSSVSITQKAGNDALPTISVPPVMDLLVRHEVVAMDTGNGINTYVAVYYKNGDQLITKLLLIYRLDTAYGYTRADVDNADFRSDYPSYSQFEYYEEPGCIYCVVRMDDLTNNAHMREAVEKEIFVVDSGSVEGYDGFLADVFLDSCRDMGYTDVPLVEYGNLHLD